jgi:hypothetical protein
VTATDEEYCGDGSRFLKLRHLPVLAVSEVKVDGETVAADEYELVKSRMLEYPEEDEYRPRLRTYGLVWPVGTNNVLVSYTYGYEAVPAVVKMATIQLAAMWYRRDGSEHLGSEGLGGRSVSYLDDDMPPLIAGKLRRYIQRQVRG